MTHFSLSIFQLDKSDNEEGVYQASGSANIILYVGLGMICIGLVITFVGLGDKGFRTLELKLIGPSLVGCGVFFALLRVLFCTVPSCCRACCKCCRRQEDKEELIYATVSICAPLAFCITSSETILRPNSLGSFVLPNSLRFLNFALPSCLRSRIFCSLLSFALPYFCAPLYYVLPYLLSFRVP